MRNPSILLTIPSSPEEEKKSENIMSFLPKQWNQYLNIYNIRVWIERIATGFGKVLQHAPWSGYNTYTQTYEHKRRALGEKGISWLYTGRGEMPKSVGQNKHHRFLKAKGLYIKIFLLYPLYRS